MERNRRQQGFTLVEVMVVAVIISILLMVAMPTYQQSVRKARRADAYNALLELAARQERFYAQNNS